MPAGGFKTFVAGEVLDQADINDYLMQGVLVFAGTAARGSAIGTAPVEGQFAFLKRLRHSSLIIAGTAVGGTGFDSVSCCVRDFGNTNFGDCDFRWGHFQHLLVYG